MKRFAELLDRLTYATARNDKLALIGQYLRETPDPDRGYALAALTDGLPGSRPLRRIILELMAGRCDPELYRLSRDYVGDTAETVALLWPGPATVVESPRLVDVVEQLSLADNATLAVLLERWLDGLDVTGRWALLKLMTGAPRVGVSARLAKLALTRVGREPVDVGEIEGLWHGLSPPYTELFAWIEGRGPRPTVDTALMFRPMMLAHPLEADEFASLDLSGVVAEWKWDGIRVQVAAGERGVRLYSRTGDDIGTSFPEILVAFAGRRGVLDGELLILRDGEVAPFNDLQQRLNRKVVTRRMLRDYPAHVRLYDALMLGDTELRDLPFQERRARLEAWHREETPPRTDLSAIVPFSNRFELERIWSSTRGSGIEGLMLKRRESPYLAGRPKGHWFKWKRAALTADCVLMYAQRGSGKRSSYYSDYTFGVWRQDGGARELVPVGKAYSGFTDDELISLDRFVRQHTVERFGPVRAVEPRLVLEIAFDSIHRSVRHKSGVAMRFPRVHRIRWDKPAAEADQLETLVAMIGDRPVGTA